MPAMGMGTITTMTTMVLTPIEAVIVGIQV